MRVRVGLGNGLEYEGEHHPAGAEFEVPDEFGEAWLRNGLVLAANSPGGWSGEPLTAEQIAALKAPRSKPETPRKHARTALAVCAEPGCPELVSEGRCEAHKPHYRRSHDVSAGLRRRWARTSRAYLEEHPYCECIECAQLPPLVRPKATEVDHRDALGIAGPRAFDWSNLQAMTKSHHSRKTASETFSC